MRRPPSGGTEEEVEVEVEEEGGAIPVGCTARSAAIQLPRPRLRPPGKVLLDHVGLGYLPVAVDRTVYSEPKSSLTSQELLHVPSFCPVGQGLHPQSDARPQTLIA